MELGAVAKKTTARIKTAPPKPAAALAAKTGKIVKTAPVPVPAPALKPPTAKAPAEEEVPTQRSAELPESELLKCKSGLTKRELTHFQDLLLQKRAQILGDVDSIQTDQRNKNGGGNLSNMPLHMADVGTDNYDQEFNLSLVESERQLLREIQDALMRLEKGYFGVCLESGKPIGKPRLEAKPWAKYCIDVAREKERRGETVL